MSFISSILSPESWLAWCLILSEDIKKNTADLVKIASFTLPPSLKSEKQKNEILVCLRAPLPPAKSEKFGCF